MATARAVPHVEKQVVVAALIFSAAMMALLAYAAVRLGISVPGCVTNVKPFSRGELIQVAPGRYEAHVVSKMFSFTPSPLRVPKGSVVDFYVISQDVVHGFYVDGTDVNLMALPDAVTWGQARFDRPGKYQVICHEFCGLGHQDMLGIIEVTP
ncbi:MAG: cytochrome C oxidase subunit II [Deltaproteobacteria bacterium]